MTSDPHPVPWRRRLVCLGAGLLTLLVAAVFAWNRTLGEALYGRGPGPWIAFGLSHLTGWVPFSVAELLVAAFLARQIAGAARGIRQAARRRRSWRRTFAAGGLRLGSDLGLAVAGFYLLWGFHYGRWPVERRWAWPEGAEVEAAMEPQVLATLAGDLVDRANQAYLRLHGVEDLGHPSARPADAAALESALEEGWRRLAAVHPLDPPARRPYGRVKHPLLSPLMSRAGISGIYFPYTGEANVNGGVPAVALPQIMAHEKAHQRGFAPENEANFLGYLAAMGAPHPLARYSAALFAQRQLLRALLRVDPEAAQTLLARRLPGVQRDVDDLVAYWERYRGAMRTFSHSVNNAYLLSNRVEGGVLSYGRSVDLLLRYAALQGGSPVPPVRSEDDESAGLGYDRDGPVRTDTGP